MQIGELGKKKPESCSHSLKFNFEYPTLPGNILEIIFVVKSVIPISSVPLQYKKKTKTDRLLLDKIL